MAFKCDTLFGIEYKMNIFLIRNELATLATLILWLKAVATGSRH